MMRIERDENYASEQRDVREISFDIEHKVQEVENTIYEISNQLEEIQDFIKETRSLFNGI